MALSKRGIKAITIGVAGLIVLVYAWNRIDAASPYVGAGETGFVWDNAAGGFTKQEIHQGWNIMAINPWTSHVIAYPTSNQTATYSRVSSEGQKGDTSIQFTSSDNLTGNIDVTVQWAVNPKKVTEVYNSYGSDVQSIQNGVIKMYVKEAVNMAAANYTYLGIHGNQKNSFAKDVNTYLSKYFHNNLDDDFILVSAPIIGQDYPPSSVQQFIESKLAAQTAQQNAATQLVTTKTNAQQQVVQAQAAATAAKTKADANLYVAQKQAEANKALEQSLTPELVQYDFVQKWDGKAPTTWSSNGSLLNMIPSVSSASGK